MRLRSWMEGILTYRGDERNPLSRSLFVTHVIRDLHLYISLDMNQVRKSAIVLPQNIPNTCQYSPDINISRALHTVR
jgi:hypothetical protein